MSVKAKFNCDSITDYGNRKEVKFSAVNSSTGENASYAKYTPFGALSMTIDESTAAFDFFQPKLQYYLTLEVANNEQV